MAASSVFSWPSVVLSVAFAYVCYLLTVLYALQYPHEGLYTPESLAATPPTHRIPNLLKPSAPLHVSIFITPSSPRPSRDASPAWTGTVRYAEYGSKNSSSPKVIAATLPLPKMRAPSKKKGESELDRAHVHVLIKPAEGSATPDFELRASAPLIKRLAPKETVPTRRLVHAPFAVALANRLGLVKDEDVDDTTPEARRRARRRSSVTWNVVPEVRFQMVNDQTMFSVDRGIPGDIHRRLKFLRIEGGEEVIEHAFVYPVHYDAFWLRRKLMEGRELPDEKLDTGAHLPTNVTVSFSYVNLGLWRVFAGLEEGLENLGNVMGGGEKESDEVRQIFAETPPLLLLCTVIVSVLHLAFDILAVKNDVSYWSSRDDVVGLSFRAVAFNIFASIVSMLYLYDNEASKLVVIGIVMTLAVDVWKLVKWMHMHYAIAASREKSTTNETAKAEDNNKGEGKEASSQIAVKARLHEVTVEADRLAGAHVASAMLVAVFLYAAYSLLVERHKGWMSWAITSLYGVAAALGFAAMTPQLFINYKLKSVEHMPWRTLVYRAINTFVDDLFSLIIDMPLGHRLSCLRDDLIFFVFLYQRHIYPPDKENRAVPDVLTGETAKTTRDEDETKKTR